MSKLQVNIIKKTEEIALYGLWIHSNDKTVSKDITALCKKYYKTVDKKSGNVLPFYILSRDYNEHTKDFDLFVGSFIQNNNLEYLLLPAGHYGIITVKPIFGFLWGPAIGGAKRYFYNQWLPKSDYKMLNMEYEYHTEKSISKNPEIEIHFGIESRKSL